MAVVNTSVMTEKEIRMVIRGCVNLWKDTQKDGVGWVSVDEKNELHGERYLYPASFIGAGAMADLIATDLVAKKLIPKRAWSPIGDGRPVPGGALICHGRSATSKKDLHSVHPFIKKGWVLTHNGVVDKPTYQKGWFNLSGCDSEDLLNCFTEGNGFEDVEDMEGWAAFFMLTPRSRTLWAVRCATAPLYLSWWGTKERGTYVLASDPEHIRTIAKKIKASATVPVPVNPNIAIEFFGPGRDEVRVHDWKGLKERRAWSYTAPATTSYVPPAGASTYCPGAASPGLTTTNEYYTKAFGKPANTGPVQTTFPTSEVGD